MVQDVPLDEEIDWGLMNSLEILIFKSNNVDVHTWKNINVTTYYISSRFRNILPGNK